MKKFRKYGVEDYLLIACGVIFILFMAYVLTGCASKQTKYQVRYMKGCAIDVSVMTADQAAKIMKDMKYADCLMETKVVDEAKE
jgi:hypothetical protein